MLKLSFSTTVEKISNRSKHQIHYTWLATDKPLTVFFFGNV